MLPVTAATTLILDQVNSLHAPQDQERVPLEQSWGRILAETLTSPLDFPHWDNSAMDGYAVQFQDVAQCNPEQPVALNIIEVIPAGYQPQKPVGSGQAARILTGSVMPAGADTVVMQEDTRSEGNQVWILKPPKAPGAFVRHRGSYQWAGSPLLSPGSRLGAAEIALLAAAQCPLVPVLRRPKVAVLSTGSELVTPDRPLQPGQIVDSNQYALTALVAQMGATPLNLGIVPDDPQALRTTIADALTIADVILSSGGVSVGDYDYVEQILSQLGGQIHIRSVAVRPGKPLTFATFPPPTDGTQGGKNPILYFGLPGNPASALVTFWRFVQPAIRKFSGLSGSWEPPLVQARSTADLRSDGKRETYLWGQLHLVRGEYEFHLASGGHSSGNLVNLTGTNGLAVLPVEQTTVTAGETVQVMQVGEPYLHRST